MRILGIWVDPKLQWKEQIKKAAAKGSAAFKAMSRITTSTWGPSMRRSRLLYMATVRPAMLHGAQVWGVRDDGGAPAKSLLEPLRKVQNQCLRRVTGAYRRTPIAAIEKEAAIPPIQLHIKTAAL